jgi:hypothetical protein
LVVFASTRALPRTHELAVLTKVLPPRADLFGGMMSPLSSAYIVQQIWSCLRLLRQRVAWALALALAEGFLHRCGGACRVHGGGFAGTILVFCIEYYLFPAHGFGTPETYKEATTVAFVQAALFELFVVCFIGLDVLDHVPRFQVGDRNNTLFLR